VESSVSLFEIVEFKIDCGSLILSFNAYSFWFDIISSRNFFSLFNSSICLIKSNSRLFFSITKISNCFISWLLWIFELDLFESNKCIIFNKSFLSIFILWFSLISITKINVSNIPTPIKWLFVSYINFKIKIYKYS
jgi:hypothetical protein